MHRTEDLVGNDGIPQPMNFNGADVGVHDEFPIRYIREKSCRRAQMLNLVHNGLQNRMAGDKLSRECDLQLVTRYAAIIVKPLNFPSHHFVVLERNWIFDDTRKDEAQESKR